MVNIMLVFGTRPEAIKMATLCHKFLEDKVNFSTTICVTGQHRQMLDQVLDIFKIEPDIDLNLMSPGQDLSDITSAVILSMRNVFKKYNPDVVLVHGDTTTAMAASMAAFYANIPIGHVEAGLRTNDLSAPFPEEFNRQIITKIAKWHFAPTELSAENLRNEGILDQEIVVTGNTVIDSLMWVVKEIENSSEKKHKIINFFNSTLSFNWEDTKFILITGHRRENFGSGFLNICEAIKELSDKYPDIHFIYPVHLNPNVKGPVNELLSNLNNVHLINPLEYEQFIFLLSKCLMILTDSGGIQEEAPSLGKPVLVMRDVTERPEAVEAGTVVLVGAKKSKIIDSISMLIDDKSLFKKMSKAHNPYGDGTACDKISDFLRTKL